MKIDTSINREFNTNQIGLMKIEHNYFGFYDVMFLHDFCEAVKFVTEKAIENKHSKFRISILIIKAHDANGDNVYENVFSLEQNKFNLLDSLQSI